METQQYCMYVCMNGAINRTVHTNTIEEQTWLPCIVSTHRAVVCVRTYVCICVWYEQKQKAAKKRSGIKRVFASITGPADTILMHSAWLHIPIHAWMNTRTLIQLNTQNVDLKKVRSSMCVYVCERACVCMRVMHDDDVNCTWYNTRSPSTG